MVHKTLLMLVLYVIVDHNDAELRTYSFFPMKIKAEHSKIEDLDFLIYLIFVYVPLLYFMVELMPDFVS
jgi:hypothetical protein